MRFFSPIQFDEALFGKLGDDDDTKVFKLFKLCILK